MKEIIKEAYKGIKNKDGGPCITVKVTEKINWEKSNHFLFNYNKTCCSEIEIIRGTDKNLDINYLTSYVLYIIVVM